MYKKAESWRRVGIVSLGGKGARARGKYWHTWYDGRCKGCRAFLNQAGSDGKERKGTTARGNKSRALDWKDFYVTDRPIGKDFVALNERIALLINLSLSEMRCWFAVWRYLDIRRSAPSRYGHWKVWRPSAIKSPFFSLERVIDDSLMPCRRSSTQQ